MMKAKASKSSTSECPGPAQTLAAMMRPSQSSDELSLSTSSKSLEWKLSPTLGSEEPTLVGGRPNLGHGEATEGGDLLPVDNIGLARRKTGALPYASAMGMSRVGGGGANLMAVTRAAACPRILGGEVLEDGIMLMGS